MNEFSPSKDAQTFTESDASVIKKLIESYLEIKKEN